MASKQKRSAGQILLRAAFIGYILWMLWLLFGQRLGTQIYTQQLAESINLKPFSTISRYIALLGSTSNAMVRHAIINLVGNVVMFIPLGFFLPRIYRPLRGFLTTFALCLVLIVAVELVQYVTALGTCDVDDLILNMVGVCIGWLFSKIKHH